MTSPSDRRNNVDPNALQQRLERVYDFMAMGEFELIDEDDNVVTIQGIFTITREEWDEVPDA